MLALEDEEIEGSVPIEAQAAPSSLPQTCVERLAELFPGAIPVRIPVQVTSLGSGRSQLREQAVIEFGTAAEVLFSSTLPLEFEDCIQLSNSDGSLEAQATVVAVRYLDGRKAVAARFAGQVSNWIIKP